MIVLKNLRKKIEESQTEDDYTIEDYINDDLAGFKALRHPNRMMKMIHTKRRCLLPSRFPNGLLSQLKMSIIDDEEILLAEEILGNIDEDGYLRRELSLIVQDLNLSYGLLLPLTRLNRSFRKSFFSIRPASQQETSRSVLSPNFVRANTHIP